mmetsp:Transcript_3173/g.7720  ORF Transcript_3173/g.7720 Transcript_3173/m.7720 type:complete len:176 (-) Transcript_3173:26-553(-)
MRWLLALAVLTKALVPPHRPRPPRTRVYKLPQETVDLKFRAKGLLDDVKRNLEEGAEMPDSAEKLRKAYVTDEHNDIYVAFLEFFMDLKLNYDVSYETDKIGPTTNPLTDIDDELTREKLPFLYDVAMTMRDGAKPEVQLGIWRLVVDKLIDRTGMSNKEFSVWASRILAEGGSA